MADWSDLSLDKPHHPSSGALFTSTARHHRERARQAGALRDSVDAVREDGVSGSGVAHVPRIGQPGPGFDAGRELGRVRPGLQADGLSKLSCSHCPAVLLCVRLAPLLELGVAGPLQRVCSHAGEVRGSRAPDDQVVGKHPRGR
jgi:hypothetical protein